MGLRDDADDWIISLIVLFFLAGFFVNRRVTFMVATVSGYFDYPLRMDCHHSAPPTDE
jgi:hypothetical protein